MKSLLAVVCVCLVSTSCGSPPSEVAAPQETTSSPVTAAPPAAVPSSGTAPAEAIDPMAATAREWSNMDTEQRQQIADHFLSMWRESDDERINRSMSATEMVVCITEDVARPDTAQTMMIMAISQRCAVKE